MQKKPLALALGAILFVYQSPVFAEAGEDSDEKTLDSIQVTATRRAENAHDVPQAVTVVGEAELRKRSGQTNADLLHGDVGTFVQQTTPGQAVVIVRGLKGSEVLHMVDGFRLNNAFFRNAPNQYPALIDPLLIEQIEVVRGPSSVLYGSDAMGGVVHMLSPEVDYSDSWENAGRLRTRYNSADSSTISRIEYSGGSERFGMRLGSTYQDVNLLRIGGDQVLPFTAYTARFADARFGFKPVDGHELTLSLQYSKQPRTPRYDELVPGFGQTVPTSSDFFFRPQERRFAQLKYEFDASNVAFDRGWVSLGRQEIVDDRLNRDFGSVNRDIEQNSSELVGFTAQFEKTLGAHYLTYGVDRYEDEVSSARQRVNVNTGALSSRPSRFPNGSTMDSIGVFVADDWQVNERLDINMGLRFGKFDIDLPPVINNTGVNIDPSRLTGNIGFNFALNEGLNLVGNYGRGFRAPNVFDLGTFGSRQGNRFNIPNGDLKPESVDTVDLGVKWQGTNWQGELLVYKSRFQDKITSVETGGRTASNQIIVQSRNATRLDLHGIEAGFRWSDGSAWSAYGSATFTRGTEQFGGLEYDADRIPPVFGRLGADYQFNANWSFSAYSFFATRQDRLSPRDLIDPRINPNGTAGYATANAAATWKILEQLDLRLSVENIGDRRYREHGTGLEEAGRSYGVGLDWRF